MFNISSLIIVMICILLGVCGQLCIKYGMNIIGEIFLKDIFSSRFFKIIFQPFIIIGIICYAFSMILWLVALSKLDLSFAYPLLSIGYIIVALFSLIFLKENISLIRWTGIMLIVIGCFLLLRS